MSITDDPTDPCLTVIEESGMQACYLVLSEAERAKGFVRPLRRSYVHQRPRTGHCGAETHMGLALCETYAREPAFYHATYCCRCKGHFPVSEFDWAEDGAKVGT